MKREEKQGSWHLAHWST